MLTSNGFVLDQSPRRLARLEPVVDAERNDRVALWRRLRRDGYLFLPRALDPDDVLAFRRHYFAAMVGTGLLAEGSDPVHGHAGSDEFDATEFRRRLFGQVVPGSEYAQFCAQPALRGWFRWFYGDEPFLHRRKIIRHVRPGDVGIGTATQAHYDLVYIREGTDRLLSVWIPIGDCPVDRGGLVYLQHSHHWVRRDEHEGTLQRPAASITADLPALADRCDSRWLVADYAAGDIVVHSPHIVHASLDNADPDGVIRLSTDIRYQRAEESIDWRWQSDWSDDDGL